MNARLIESLGRAGHILLPTSSALLWAAAMPPFDLWYLRWFALLPLVVFLYRERTPRRLFFGAFVFGVVAATSYYQTALTLLPLDWLGIREGFMGGVLLVGTWLFFCLSLASAALVLPLVRALPLAFFPAVWILYERVQSLLYALVTLGPPSSFGDHFTLASSALSFHDSPLFRSFAPYIGLYGLSALIAAVAVALFVLYKKGHAWNLLIGALLLVGLGTMEFTDPHPAGAPAGLSQRIGVVALQANNPPRLHYDYDYYKMAAAHYVQGVTEALAAHPDAALVVAPEYSDLLESLSLESRMKPAAVAAALLGTTTPRFLMYGSRDVAQQKPITVLQGSTREESVIFSKTILMPMGEYQPYLFSFWLRLVAGSSRSAEIADARNQARGIGEQESATLPFGRLFGLSCSEVLSGEVWDSARRQRPSIIAVMQRLALFHGGEGLFRQMLALVQLRSAQARVPVAGSVDGGGYSYILDSGGNVVALGSPGDAYVYASVYAVR